jgi:hypothetical protein
MPIVFPDQVLEVRVNLPAPNCDLDAYCIGYEGGAWRAAALADHLFNWLPFTALNQEHQLAFNAANFVPMLRLAAAHIYNTRKTSSRGELGELLLHLIAVLHHGAHPVLCKLVLKTSPNDTVKGFDGVHLVSIGDDFELWLGESKFYKNPLRAIRDAVASVKIHILPAFLNAEKAMIFSHIAPDIPHRESILRLFRSQTSSDELLRKAVFPILIAYESSSVQRNSELCEAYTQMLKSEVENLKDSFSNASNAMRIRFRLLFVPVGSKNDLISQFDARLRPFL